MGIGDKIARFEELDEQTVQKFNEVFPESKLSLSKFRSDMEVEVGPIVGPENVRELIVGGETIVHKIHYEILMPLDLPEDLQQEHDNRVYMRKDNTVVTNDELENLVLTEKEMKLEPIEYLLLQYFRGCQSPYHTQIEVAERLNKSARGIRDILKRMEHKGLIKIKNIVNHHRIYIRVTEEWA